MVYQGNYDEYLEWRDGAGAEVGENLLASYGMGSSSGRSQIALSQLSSRDLQKQRKIAEGELRNSYYQESSPLKKRINVIESELAKQEQEFRELESYFAAPEGYGDSAEITAKTIRHHELKKTIAQLAEEWEKKSLEAEQKRQEFEEAKKGLETGFGREEDNALDFVDLRHSFDRQFCRAEDVRGYSAKHPLIHCARYGLLSVGLPQFDTGRSVDRDAGLENG